MFFFSLTIFVGVFIGNLQIPLPGELHFSLGVSGGVLFTALFFGSLDGLGNNDMQIEKSVLETMREFGLVLFLASAGVEAGQGFIETLKEYGIILFAVGMIITMIPIFVGFFSAHQLLKLDMYSSLGSVCGGMTSTPALGSLSDMKGYDNVASAYAATYSIVTIVSILSVQIVYVLFS